MLPPCEGELVQVAENLIVEAGTQLREGLTVEDIDKRYYNQPQQKVLLPHNDHHPHLSQAGLLNRLSTAIQLNINKININTTSLKQASSTDCPQLSS